MTLDRYGWLYPSAEAALTDALDAPMTTRDNVVPLDRRDDEEPPAGVAAAI